VGLPWISFARESYLYFNHVEGSPSIKLHHCLFLLIAIIYVVWSALSKNRKKLIFEIPIAIGVAILLMRLILPFIAYSGWVRYFGIFPLQLMVGLFSKLFLILPERPFIRVVLLLCIAVPCLFGCHYARLKIENYCDPSKQSKIYALLGPQLLISSVFVLTVIGTVSFFWMLFLVIPGYLVLFSESARRPPKFFVYSLLYTSFGGAVMFICGIGNFRKDIASVIAEVMGRLSHLFPSPHEGIVGFFEYYFSAGTTGGEIFPQLFFDVCFAVPLLALCICYVVFARPCLRNATRSKFLLKDIWCWRWFIISAFLTASLNGYVVDTLGVGTLVRTWLEPLPEQIGDIIYWLLAVCTVFLIRDFILIITNQTPERIQYKRVSLIFLTIWLCTGLYSDTLLTVFLLITWAVFVMFVLQVCVAVFDALVEIYPLLPHESDTVKTPEFLYDSDGRSYQIHEAADGREYYYKPGKGYIWVYNNGSLIWDDEENHYTLHDGYYDGR